ncbi:unnamed protein product [Sympodiomycopsis kandeliae]
MNRLYPASGWSITSTISSSSRPTATAAIKAVSLTRPYTTSPPSRSSSWGPKLTRPPQQYPSHIPLASWEKHFLSVGSTLASLINPSRGDMIALLSETSGERFLPKILDDVMKSHEGRKMIIEKPRLTTKSIDMTYLRGLDDDTFGKRYTEWLDWCRVGPDTRAQVQYISNPQEAYLMQRYRESHDFYHMLCGMPVNALGETVVKIFEFAHFGLPVALLSSIAGPLRLTNQERYTLFNELAPWAWEMGKESRRKMQASLLSVRWEHRWEMDFKQMQREFGITDPPVHVSYDVKRGQLLKKRGWTTKTVQNARAKAAQTVS